MVVSNKSLKVCHVTRLAEFDHKRPRNVLLNILCAIRYEDVDVTKLQIVTCGKFNVVEIFTN